MNIFKVFASGKKTLGEEQMSAVLAWLLHPHMEHGLGYEFLSRFISAIAAENVDYEAIKDKLKKRLRGAENISFGIELEKNVPNAFIDIVVTIDDWKIGIENKIYPGSASDYEQLNREYHGMKVEYGEENNCTLIFLVPYSGENLASNVLREFETFDERVLREKDYLALMTWQKNDENHPSVSTIIETILSDESIGLIEPLPEYTRHTLKALQSFIRDGFKGYEYEKEERRYDQFPRFFASDVFKKDAGYVGIKGGITGLLSYDSCDPDKLKNARFQFDENAEDAHSSQWLPLDLFKQVYNWRINKKPPAIDWRKQSLPAQNLYEIAKDCNGQPLYIGIRGGKAALERMEPERIKTSKWSINKTLETPKPEWIPIAEFYRIIKSKRIFESEIDTR